MKVNTFCRNFMRLIMNHYQAMNILNAQIKNVYLEAPTSDWNDLYQSVIQGTVLSCFLLNIHDKNIHLEVEAPAVFIADADDTLYFVASDGNERGVKQIQKIVKKWLLFSQVIDWLRRPLKRKSFFFENLWETICRKKIQCGFKTFVLSKGYVKNLRIYLDQNFTLQQKVKVSSVNWFVVSKLSFRSEISSPELNETLDYDRFISQLFCSTVHLNGLIDLNFRKQFKLVVWNLFQSKQKANIVRNLRARHANICVIFWAWKQLCFLKIDKQSNSRVLKVTNCLIWQQKLKTNKFVQIHLFLEVSNHSLIQL